MAATPGGGGGGRSFPVYIDLITRGADQAANQIRGVETSLGNIGNVSKDAASGLQQTSNAGRAAAGSLQTAGSAAKLTSQGLASGVSNANSFSAGLKQVQGSGDAVTGSLEKSTAATEKMHRGTSGLSTAFTAFRQSGRGAQFAMIGLVGSVNEAVFMIQSFAEAQQKVGAAQAEVDRLVAEGAQGTKEYSDAVNDLQDAQRGANFTSRIMAQSILDNVTFSGMLLSQLPKVVSEYRRLRTEAAQSASVMGQQGGIMQRLSSLFGGFGRSTQTVVQATQAATESIASMGTSAGTAGNALSTVGSRAAASAGQMRLFPQAISATEAAFTGISSSAGRAGGALTGVGTAAKGSALQATSAVLGFQGLAVAQDRAGQAAAAASGPTANSGRIAILSGTQAGAGALGWHGLAAGIGSASKAALMFAFTNPIGILITAFAGIVILLIALKENFMGWADSLYQTGAALGQMFPVLQPLLEGLEGFARWLGIIPSEEKKVAEAHRQMSEDTKQLSDEIMVLGESIVNFGQGWEDVGNRTRDILQGIQQDTFAFASAFGDSLVTQLDFVHEKFNELADDDPLKDFYAAQLFYLESIQQHVNVAMTEVETSLAHTTGEVGRFGSAWEKTWNDILTQAGSAPQVISALPEAVGDAVGEMAEIVDKAFDDGTLDVAEHEQVIRGILTRTWVEPMKELGPEFEAAFGQFLQHAKNIMDDTTLTPEQTVEALRNLNAAFLQTIGPLTQVASATDQAEAAADAHAEAEKRRAEVMEQVAEGLTGLNEESLINLNINRQILASTNLHTQAFDRNAVAIAAQVSGLQQWHDVKAQALFTIIESATALGFEGDVLTASTAQMLQHIATTERQNEMNETAVESYFNLSEAQQDSLGTLDITDELMGRVAEKQATLTVAQARGVAEQERLNQASMEGVEAYFKLDEGQIARLRSLGLTEEVIQQVINGQRLLTAEEIAAINTEEELTEATDEHAETISGLIPQLQQYAAALGLVGLQADQLTMVQQAVTQSLVDSQSAYETSIQDAVDFAASQGQLQEVSGMSVTELGKFIATMEVTGDTAETAAERQQAAAEKMAAVWERDLDRAIEAWNNSSEAFATAASNIEDEIGDAGAEGAAKFTQGFLSEFVPQQVVEEAFDENFDVEDLIDDIKDKAEDAFDDGLISEVAMRDAIDPMIEEMEKIPGETEFHMGQMIAVARNAMNELQPAISGGIHEVGRDAMDALDTSLLQPMLSAMESGAGTQVWQPLVDNFRTVVNSLPPEYDRMKGDWLMTLQQAGTDTRSQVNAIMGILQEIAPEWAEQIMQIDADADGIKDIFDDDIKTPAEQMRDAIVDAMIIAAKAVGDFTTAANLDFFRDQLNETEEAARQAADPLWEVASAEEEVANKAGLISTPVSDYAQWFEDLPPDVQASARELYNAATAITGSGTAADTATGQIEQVPVAFGAYSRIPGQTEGPLATVGEQLNAVPGTATTAAEDSVTNFTSGWLGGGWTGLLNPVNEGLSDTSGAEAAGKEYATAFNRGFASVQALAGAAENTTGAIGNIATEREEFQRGLPGEGGAGAAAKVPPPDFTEADAAWTAYHQRINTTMTQIDATILTSTTQWSAYFMIHGQSMGATLTSMILPNITLYSQMLAGLVTLSGVYMPGMTLQWQTHGMAVQTAIMTQISPQITLYSQLLTALVTYGITSMTQMSLLWLAHGMSVSTSIGMLNASMGVYNGMLAATAGSVLTQTTQMSVHWLSHAGSVGSTVGTLTGHMASLGGVVTSTRSTILTQTTQMSAHWVSHQQSVGSSVNSIEGHMDGLAGNISDNMGDIVSDVNAAKSAIDALKRSIDALESKTITITVNAVGSGLRFAQHGMNEVVHGPTLILAGEAGTEHVQVTPMTGGAPLGKGKAGGGLNFMAAAKGANMIVTPWDNKAVSTFAGERGHRVREIKDEMEDEEKMVVRVDKVYKNASISKEEWNTFAREYGFKVKDVDKKKYGHEVDFKMMKGARPLAEDLDTSEGFGGGIGDEGGFRGGFGDEDFGSGGGRAVDAVGGMHKPVRPGGAAGGGGGGGGTGSGTVTVGGGGGGGGGTTGAGGITKIVFNGPITVQTALDVTLEIDHQKFGRLSRQVTAEGYAQTK